MKQFLSYLVFGLASFSLSAQKEISSIQEIVVYGVDFSKSKGFLLTENPDDIQYAFIQINRLLKDEARKYNFQKYFKKNVVGYYTESAEKNNERMNMEDFLTREKVEALSQDDVQDLIESIDTGDRNKTGLILIADFLDKQAARATYQVVFFDEATKEIIYSKSMKGKAGGFGLRNYWAGSIFHLMKHWSY